MAREMPRSLNMQPHGLKKDPKRWVIGWGAPPCTWMQRRRPRRATSRGPSRQSTLYTSHIVLHNIHIYIIVILCLASSVIWYIHICWWLWYICVLSCIHLIWYICTSPFEAIDELRGLSEEMDSQAQSALPGARVTDSDSKFYDFQWFSQIFNGFHRLFLIFRVFWRLSMQKKQSSRPQEHAEEGVVEAEEAAQHYEMRR